VALQFLLLGNVLMREISWISRALNLDLTSSFPIYAASSVAALLFPLGVAAGVYKVFQGPILAGDEDINEKEVDPDNKMDILPASHNVFVESAYGYLPLVWSANLAYWSSLFFNEAGRVLPVTAATLGMDMPWLPEVIMDPHITAFIQCSVLGFGGAASVMLSMFITQRSFRDMLPQTLTILGLDALVAWLVIGH